MELWTKIDNKKVTTAMIPAAIRMPKNAKTRMKVLSYPDIISVDDKIKTITKLSHKVHFLPK